MNEEKYLYTETIQVANISRNKIKNIMIHAHRLNPHPTKQVISVLAFVVVHQEKLAQSLLYLVVLFLTVHVWPEIIWHFFGCQINRVLVSVAAVAYIAYKHICLSFVSSKNRNLTSHQLNSISTVVKRSWICSQSKRKLCQNKCSIQTWIFMDTWRHI